MPMTYQPVFAQTHRYNLINVLTANAALDGSGSISPCVYAGPNGALLTHVHASATGTIVASSVRMFISLDNGTSWQYLLAGAIAAYTLAQTTASSSVTLINRSIADQALRLPANAIVGFTTAVTVANNIRVSCEWVDY